MAVEPASMGASVGASACVHTFNLEYLEDNKANRNQILYEASLRRGKGCIRFWARSD